MKIRIALQALVFMALFSACTENAMQLETPKSEKTPGKERTLDEILEIARNAPATFETAATRSGQKAKEIDASSLKAIPSKQTRSGESISSSLYAINYADNNGYVIISGNQATPGVIAYIEEGQYDIEDMQDNSTSIGYVTNLATAYVESTYPPFNPPEPGYPDTVTTTIGPFLTTDWGQYSPAGTYCINGLCGCTILALAQVMSYHEYPETIQLTYPEADQSMVTLDWSEIKKHRIKHSTFPLFQCSASEEAHNNLGRLCRQLGHMSGTTYGEHSVTSNNRLKQTIQQLNFQFHENNTDQEWLPYTDTCTVGPLERMHPLLVCGFEVGETVGHMFVVDGLIRQDITRTFMYTDSIVIENETIIYNHVDWGWDGMNNGYVLSSIFDTSRMYKKDRSIYAPIYGDFNFVNSQYYLEIFPPTSN